MTPYAPVCADLSDFHGLGVSQADQTLQRASERQERGSMSENLRDEFARALMDSWRSRPSHPVAFKYTFAAMADAAWDKVAPELDHLRAEVERLKRQERGQTTAAMTAWRAADVSRERVKAAEAECAVLRERLAKVGALAKRGVFDVREWGERGTPYSNGAGYAFSKVRAILASVPEPSDSEPADGVTVVASTPDGVERWTEYGVQADDGSVPWVYAEEGLARLRADMSGGLVVGSTVTRSPWLPVLMDAADAYRKKPAPDADREAGER